MLSVNINDVDNILFKRRSKALSEARIRKEELFKNNPHLEQLDQKIRLLLVQRIRAMRNAQSYEIIDENLLQARKEFSVELEKLEIDANYLEPQYECSMCNDTGYIGSQRCTCASQLIFDILYREASIDSADQSFESFDLSVFDGNDETSKKQRAEMEKIHNFSVRYAEKFDVKKSSNLIFIGQTGTGKTFLSNCIARSILKKGHSVLVLSSYLLIEMLKNAVFSGSSALKKLTEVELLVIDELGMEQMLNNVTIEMLFMVINERYRKGLPIIVNSNLLPDQMEQRYTERITSRLFDKANSTVLLFQGHDIRLKNKK
jgi:DNA replication protein DnaC